MEASDWAGTKGQIEDRLTEIENKIKQLVKLTRTNYVSCQSFKLVAHDGRPLQLKPVDIDEALENYGFQHGTDTANMHPIRIIGTIFVSSSVEKEVRDLIDDINHLKTKFKEDINEKIPSYHQRQKAIREANNSVLLKSIYRRVNAAPVDTYRINYAWSDKGLSVDYIEKEEAEKIVEDNAKPIMCPDTGVLIKSADDVATDDLKQLYLAIGEKYAIVKHIKLFPQQSINYLNESGKRQRYIIKATSPLIVFVEHGESPPIHKLPKDPKALLDDTHNGFIPVIPEIYLFKKKIGQVSHA